MAGAEPAVENINTTKTEPKNGPDIRPTKKNTKKIKIALANNKFTSRLENQAEEDDSIEEQEYAEKQEAELQASWLLQSQPKPSNEPRPTPNWTSEASEPNNNQTKVAEEIDSTPVNHEDQEDQLQGEQENKKNMSALAKKQLPGGQMPGISGLSADSAEDIIKKQAKKKVTMWILSAIAAASPYIFIAILLILAGIFIGLPTYCAYERGTVKNAWSWTVGKMSGEGAWNKVINDAMADCAGTYDD